MYLETIIDQTDQLQIIYHYPDDRVATLLQAAWSELDKFCAPKHKYEIRLEHFDPEKGDISQTYVPTDLKTWVAQLPAQYKQQLVQQFVSYCEQHQPSKTISFFH